MPSANMPANTNHAATATQALDSIIHNLYFLQIQALNFTPPNTSNAMIDEVTHLIRNLQQLSTSSAQITEAVPQEILEYVENGRNPDIYTREFVELVQRINQTLKGKEEGFGRFSNILAEEIKNGIPDLADGVDAVMEETVE